MNELFALEEVGMAAPGFRLERLEVLGWGTFNRAVWQFRLDGCTALLTGDIGSGKSTLVDALTTLLLPANRISYNKAAGAETRERDLRSYVLGHYKSERNETTGASRPVALRDHRSHSVLLAAFRHEHLDHTVTLAQVFWLPEGAGGQPSRIYVVAEAPLTIADHFTGFGSDIGELRRRLRADGFKPHTAFPDYDKAFRRALGIPSRQAMDLFHQTVSLKSVGNLTDFVREHMLEPFDNAEKVRALVDHFEDLTAAHNAVLKARRMLAGLDPIVTLGDEIADSTAQITRHEQERSAMEYAGARLTLDLLAAEHQAASDRARRAQAESDRHTGRLGELQAEQTGLHIAREGHAGGRIGVLEEQIRRHGEQRDERRRRLRTFDAVLGEAGLPGPLTAADEIEPLKQQAADRLTAVHDELAGIGKAATALAVEEGDLQRESTQIRDELTSLRERRSSIPREQIELRRRLAADLGIPEDDLPYAGELVQVADAHREWAGAAERVLRAFALSLVVPDRHYEAVSGWVDGHHLGGRLVYHRVRHGEGDPRAVPESQSLAAKLDVRPGPLAPWVRAEIAARADHLCVRTVGELRRTRRGVTIMGQVKTGWRHEKDDRRRLDDASTRVLGWDNTAKVEALIGQGQRVQGQLNEVRARCDEVSKQRAAAEGRREALASVLDQDARDVDWWESARLVDDAERQLAQLRDESDELGRIETRLAQLRPEIDAAAAAGKAADRAVGEAVGEVRRLDAGIASARAVAQRQPGDLGEAVDRAGEALLARGLSVADAVSPAVAALTADLTSRIEKLGEGRRTRQSRAERLMGVFRDDFPEETKELDANVVAMAEFRELRDRVDHDDLPRFESEFKTYLNENAIREIAAFQARLNDHVSLIHERIQKINDSLHEIDYNPGRYIRLEPHPTNLLDVRDFRRDLRACTEDVIGGSADEQYSEAKFEQVEAIMSRFRGRDGRADSDRAWTERVTDVRNWLTFSASERWREDDAEHETYSDSDGKSGGQKEKLAYTILAASLAYQFRLDERDPRARTFRFAVIDEAFGRGSDESTRYGLHLFRRLGLQLLVVTPLQKVHTIEPFVQRVGFVDNPTGAASRLRTMSITEYRDLRRQFATARATDAQ